MKKILFVLLIFSLMILNSKPVHAQAWERNSRVLSLGLGVSQFYHIDNYYYYNYYGGPNYHHNGEPKNNRRWYSPTTGQFNFQGEFGIHKYVGIGFKTGFGGRGNWPNAYASEINIPVGVLANFHFYQLIADRSDKNIHADKLDIYAGVSAGSGVAFTFYENDTRVVPLAFGGIHAGIRYYFTEKVGLTAEAGWGMNLVNAGLVFKL